ncbi:MAG: DNA-binding protein [Candidatus Aureabacteria bacterium]|nr:DNA-binding protein [Candidatus Auribacterota bacterium]
MKYSEAEFGRVFVLRLEDGDILHEEIEECAEKNSVHAGFVILVGGADEGSRLVVGPEDGRVNPPSPVEHILEGVHEIAGVGTLFPDETEKPVLHMHMASGRKDRTVTGCVRRGVRVWQIMEGVLIEIKGCWAKRIYDEKTGFKLLQV